MGLKENPKSDIDSQGNGGYICTQIRRGSSVVEQRIHKPLVGSSTLPPATNEGSRKRAFFAFWGSPGPWIFCRIG